MRSLRRIVPLAVLLAACSGGSSETPATPGSTDRSPAPAPTQADGGGQSPPATARPAVDPTEEACAEQILVGHDGSDPRDPAITRTRDAALARATALLGRLQAGESFEDVARAESDHRSKARGGLIGTFRRSEIPPAMAEAIYALGVGVISPAPVETPAGFHLFKRLPVDKVRARHILIRYRGARNDRGAVREKPIAEKVARSLRARAALPDADFAALARQHSDDASAAQGGDLGEFGRGAMVAAFDEAVFRLAPDEISDVVESEFGFHIIQRLP
jgi:parvulin-like peptidyl-prolyl isomerase